MTNTAFPMQYLDKAMNGLHDLGLLPEGDEAREEPIIALLNQISELDEARVTAIARTLNQASLFNDIVREQVQATGKQAHIHGVGVAMASGVTTVNCFAGQPRQEPEYGVTVHFPGAGVGSWNCQTSSWWTAATRRPRRKS